MMRRLLCGLLSVVVVGCQGLAPCASNACDDGGGHVDVPDSAISGTGGGGTDAGSGTALDAGTTDSGLGDAGDRGTYRLIYATSADYANPMALEGATITQDIWVRLEVPGSPAIDHTEWLIDGSLFRSDDLSPPYDLTYLPAPFAFTAWSAPGVHQVMARVVFAAAGGLELVAASLTVDTGPQDAGRLDGGAPDGGVPDGGAPDGGARDAGLDAGATDAGAVDAACPSPGGSVTFLGDWAGDSARGGWSAIQVVSADRLRRDPMQPTWHGKAAARVEVRPGDHPLSLGTERAEVLFMQGSGIDESPSSGTQFYGLSYRLPTGWDSPQRTSGDWAIFFQLHGPDTLHASPVFSLHADPTRWRIATFGGDLNVVTPPWAVFHDLSEPSVLLDRWVDFIIMIAYAANNTGHISIWRRDEGENVFARVLDLANIATLQYRGAGGVGSHYWKQGLYRQAYSATNVFWMGPAVRASSFAAAEAAAFGTCFGPQ